MSPLYNSRSWPEIMTWFTLGCSVCENKTQTNIIYCPFYFALFPALGNKILSNCSSEIKPAGEIYPLDTLWLRESLSKHPEHIRDSLPSSRLIVSPQYCPPLITNISSIDKTQNTVSIIARSYKQTFIFFSWAWEREAIIQKSGRNLFYQKSPIPFQMMYDLILRLNQTNNISHI